MTVTKETSDPKASAKWHKVRQKIKGKNKGYYVINKLTHYDPKTNILNPEQSQGRKVCKFPNLAKQDSNKVSRNK